jgi:hypothetical protein
MKPVALVLDTEFGERLERLASEMPVWIVASPMNDFAVERTRRLYKEADVTTYFPLDPSNRESACAQALYDIDEHHGPLSTSDPYDEILVIGANRADISSNAMDELHLELSATQGFGLTLRKQCPEREVAR